MDQMSQPEINDKYIEPLNCLHITHTKICSIFLKSIGALKNYLKFTVKYECKIASSPF